MVILCFNRAAHALNPKDLKFTYTPRTSPNEAKDSPENIEERIKRLSRTLADKVEFLNDLFCERSRASL